MRRGVTYGVTEDEAGAGPGRTASQGVGGGRVCVREEDEGERRISPRR